MSNYLLGVLQWARSSPKSIKCMGTSKSVAILWDRYRFSLLEIEEVIAQRS